MKRFFGRNKQQSACPYHQRSAKPEVHAVTQHDFEEREQYVKFCHQTLQSQVSRFVIWSMEGLYDRYEHERSSRYP
jgi:hypothetical protein